MNLENAIKIENWNDWDPTLPVGAILQYKDGHLWRVYVNRAGHKGVRRMTKRTKNGIALKAGETI